MKKRMKSTATMVLAFVLTGAVLAGCGESPDSQRDDFQGISLESQQESGENRQQEAGGNQQKESSQETGGDRQESQQETGENQQEAGGNQQNTQQETSKDQQEAGGNQQETQQETSGNRQETGGNPQQGSAEDEAGTESMEGSSQTAAGYEDNFAVDGKAAKEFAQKVQAAVADKDLEALADLTAFPVYVGLPDVKGVGTREDFLKLGAEAVFTEELLKAVANADIENFQPSMAGFSISGGGSANIIFGVVDGALAITGINY